MLRRNFLKAATAALAGLGFARPGRVLSLKAGELKSVPIDPATRDRMRAIVAEYLSRNPDDQF